MIDSRPPVRQGDLLRLPSPDDLAHSNLSQYTRWLAETRGLAFDAGADYSTLWEWSVNDLGEFWTSIADYYGVRFHTRATSGLSSLEMPGAKWFPGATLNYAERVFDLLGQDSGAAVLIYESEPLPAGGAALREEITREELARRVGSLAAALRARGITRGDRVAGYLPNVPESVVAFLAAASIGAIWSNCPAELSSRGVIERFFQIEPKILFVVDHYRYGGKMHDRSEAVREIIAGLPSLQDVILVPSRKPGAGAEKLDGITALRRWDEFAAADGPAVPLTFEPVPFEHPLWILYSSGTTGVPKAIVQGHGGIILEHLKTLSLHFDLRTGDRFFWFTTSGWMMWNMLVSGLLLPGVAVLLYDGSPKFPNFGALWSFLDRNGVTYFGTSAPYLLACMKDGIVPSVISDFPLLRGIGSTGAPLPPDAFAWIHANVKQDVLIGSASGGTDVCTAFVLSNPLLPEYAGELQCVGLGAKIEAAGDDGEPLFSEVGELVIRAPFPSMPVQFWNDPDGARMRASYYERFAGNWCHGDWIEIAEPGQRCVISGRSDSTLNRGGVRMGTAEFYSVVEDLPEVAEALVIDTGGLGREDKLLLFIVPSEGRVLDEALRAKINGRLRTEVSPRHVPDAIYATPEIPHTLNGKKLEVPVKRLLTGTPIAKAVSRESVANPTALDYFIELAATVVPRNS